MSKKWYRIDSPTPSYDNPIPRDSLEYMKDRLLGTLERPEIIDRLGDMALGLSNVAQMLEPMGPPKLDGEELGDSHDDPDWTHKDVIPLIGYDEFIVSGKQISHMPVQKTKIEEFLDNNGCSLVYNYIKALPPTRKEHPGTGGFCNSRLFGLDDGTFYVVGRPVVGVANWGISCVNVAVLSHEVAHAWENVMNPIVTTRPDDEREILRSELQAHAISALLESYLLGEERIQLNRPSTSSQVESIRRDFNGPMTSEGAFDPHRDLVKSIQRKVGNIFD